MSKVDVFIIDDDDGSRKLMETILKKGKISCRSFSSPIEALSCFVPGDISCIITDYQMPDMTGTEFVEYIRKRDDGIPILMVSGHGTVNVAVDALHKGVTDFIEKPFRNAEVVQLVNDYLVVTEIEREQRKRRISVLENVENLTTRECHILKLLSYGLSNKEIALKLDISYRTVEVHRARIIDKLGAKSIIDLVRVADKI